MDSNSNNLILAAVETDFDGNYNFYLPRHRKSNTITVDIEVSYLNYQKQRIEGVIVESGKANQLNVQISEEHLKLNVIVCGGGWAPIISPDDFSSGQTLYSEDIQHRANRKN